MKPVLLFDRMVRHRVFSAVHWWRSAFGDAIVTRQWPSTAVSDSSQNVLALAHGAHAVCKRLGESQHARHKIGCRFAVAVETSRHAVDNGGADNGCVRVTRDRRRLLRRFDSEADADRQLGMAANTLYVRAYRVFR